VFILDASLHTSDSGLESLYAYYNELLARDIQLYSLGSDPTARCGASDEHLKMIEA
jgi:hypothetical protein